MTLIERYLQAVKMWLPKEQKNDIIAELSEDIQASIEEQEAALGRNLSEREIAALLKQRGSPFVVANRFLPQQALIGPLLFPLYVFVLKIVGVCYVVLWLVLRHFGVLVQPALTSFAVVTLVFAILDRWQWRPDKLPVVRNRRLISRTGSCFELAINLFVLVWWVESFSSGNISLSSGFQITLSAVWPRFFAGYLLLMLAIIALSCVNLMRPYWTGTRSTLRLVTDAVGAVLFCWLMQANIVIKIAATGLSPKRAGEVTNSINQLMGKSLPWAVIVCLGIVAFDAYRIFRLKNSSVPLPAQAAYFNNV